MNFYNEIDHKKAEWLRELIAHNVISQGIVDERSIKDLEPHHLDGYAQCHFFAGIGAWSFALRLAGVPDDLPLWTGSCPCQPFSVAGEGKGETDERHLWPAWFHLISQRRPGLVFGEQVADGDGISWLDNVQSQMESVSYRVGPCVLPASGFGAPHARHRTFFVADSDQGRRTTRCHVRRTPPSPPYLLPGQRCETLHLADARLQNNGRGSDNGPGQGAGPLHRQPLQGPSGLCPTGLLADPPLPRSRPISNRPDGETIPDPRRRNQTDHLDDTLRTRLEGLPGNGHDSSQPRRLQPGPHGPTAAASPPGPTNGFWSNATWIPTRGKLPRTVDWRPIKPLPLPLDDGPSSHLLCLRNLCLAHHQIPASDAAEASYGFPLIKKSQARTLRLKGYGDAIVPQVAAHFINAYLQTLID